MLISVLLNSLISDIQPFRLCFHESRRINLKPGCTNAAFSGNFLEKVSITTADFQELHSAFDQTPYFFMLPFPGRIVPIKPHC